ncbi:hypothetical protein [Desulfitobacterium hafniense]|nr:hypothetical protein [Desulfitobacterium hafniense]
MTEIHLGYYALTVAILAFNVPGVTVYSRSRLRKSERRDGVACGG